MLTDYRTDDTCATVHVRHATTDRNTLALPTRGHTRPRVHCAGRPVNNLRAHRSLCYSTRARWPHVGTPAHLCTVYDCSGLNLHARAGRYTTSQLLTGVTSRLRGLYLGAHQDRRTARLTKRLKQQSPKSVGVWKSCLRHCNPPQGRKAMQFL